MVVMSKGNSKLDKSILCWSITPVKSCLNNFYCASKCYAMKAYRIYPNTKKAWDRNFEYAKDGSFVEHIINQLNKNKSCKVVRIHVAGDFFSTEYIENWKKIILQFPDINFYTYTKVYNIFPDELKDLNSLSNCNIIDSITDDGGINFGDSDRINTLKHMGYFICPAGKHSDIICGKDCKECITNNKVCFRVH